MQTLKPRARQHERDRGTVTYQCLLLLATLHPFLVAKLNARWSLMVYRGLQEEKAEDVSEELIADVKALAYLLFLSECRSALVLKRSPALVPTAVRGSLSISRWSRGLAQRGHGRGRRRATRELEGGETLREQNRRQQNRLAFFRPPKIAGT